MIAPKLLLHNCGKLHAYRGQNRIAWRFGRRILVCEIHHVFGPFWKRRSDDFFERIDRFRIPTLEERAEAIARQSDPVYSP